MAPVRHGRFRTGRRLLPAALATARCGLLALQTVGPMRILVLPVLLLAACDHPTQPTGPAHAAVPIRAEAFEVAGVVTDERGTPMADATVTLGHWLAGTLLWASTVTDPSGNYRISSKATLRVVDSSQEPKLLLMGTRSIGAISPAAPGPRALPSSRTFD